MIAFFGYGSDSSLERAVQIARTRAAPHFFVDQEAPDGIDVCLEQDARGLSGSVSLNATEISLQDVTAIYARPLAPRPENMLAARAHGQGLRDVFVEWFEVTDCLIVNRPSAMHSNGSKPYQAEWLARLGFDVPDTLVTSDPEEALAFWRTHGNVVFKSTSGIRSIVAALDAQTARHLPRLRNLPTQFQAAIPGVDVRVHVVGERLFATEIVSAATDYRYAHREQQDVHLSVTSLPDAVAERCVVAAKALDLPFCGVDLRRRPDGGYVCFEINPMPGYSYYEGATGQPISHALVDLLLEG